MENDRTAGEIALCDSSGCFYILMQFHHLPNKKLFYEGGRTP